MVVLILQLWKNEMNAPLTLKSGTVIENRHQNCFFFSCILLFISGLVWVFLWLSGFYSKKVEEPSAKHSQLHVAYLVILGIIALQVGKSTMNLKNYKQTSDVDNVEKKSLDKVDFMKKKFKKKTLYRKQSKILYTIKKKKNSWIFTLLYTDSLLQVTRVAKTFQILAQNCFSFLGMGYFHWLNVIFVKKYHSVEISGIFFYSDFTWNQFWRM